jgi:hypothetical protein
MTPAAVRVLSRLARYGAYFWEPGELAVLDDPWRNRVHVGSVGGLLRQGMLISSSANTLQLTGAGTEALRALEPASTAMSKRRIRNVLVEADARGFAEPKKARLVASRLIDVLRVVENSTPASWELLVDLALASRTNPDLQMVLREVLDSVDFDSRESPELEIRLTALGPRDAGRE